ncbi:MAG: hypothetical protein Q4E53_11915, partial [Eubacteriales bacterium]|nr:hypothetical protein [Eubacteriales bacterium]
MSTTEIKTKKKKSPWIGAIKAGAIMLLLFLAWFLCSHFMEYQKNATNQVNKYRIDQLCLLTDQTTLEQRFKAKHTHLKTLKLYSSNDYGGEAAGMLHVDIVEEESGNTVFSMEHEIKSLINNGYTDLNTDLQLEKGKIYIIRITSEGAESGKEPIFYQWSTKEKGFRGKVILDGLSQRKYLVAKFYYPVLIYQHWAAICLLIALVIGLILFKIPLLEKIRSLLGRVLFYLAPLFTFWMVERFTDNLINKMRPGEFAFNILLYYMFFGILYLMFYSRRLSTLIGMLFWYIVGIGNYFVL